MKTKNLIKKKMIEIKAADVKFKVVEQPYLNFIHRFPYKKRHQFNYLYWFLCQYLIPNENALGFLTDDGFDYISYEALQVMSGIPYDVFKTKFWEMRKDGVIIEIRAGMESRYFINPYFAVAGDTVSGYLLDIVEHGGLMLGSELFANDDSLQHDNRNKDKRFGNMKVTNRSVYFTKI